jgi:hypothetical protein
MNFERIISFFVVFDWLFLSGWVLVLGAAFVVTFPKDH